MMKADIRGLGHVCSKCINDAKRMWNGKWVCFACYGELTKKDVDEGSMYELVRELPPL